MAYRGRGRGGYGGSHYVKEDPFVLFPVINLPDATGILSSSDLEHEKKNKEEETLLIKESLEWLKKTEYYLEQTDKDNKQPKGNREIDSFSQYLVRSMFPRELTRGSNVRELSREKVKWDTEMKLEMYWDLIEKKEEEIMVAKKKKEGENDEDKDKDDDDEEEDDNMSADYDYISDLEQDDDEDPYNEDEGEDEPLL